MITMTTTIPVQPLTVRQQAFLEDVLAYYTSFGLMPTYGDLEDRLGLSRNGVASLLKRVAKRGWVEIDEKTARGIRLTPVTLETYRRVEAAPGGVRVRLLVPDVVLSAQEARVLVEQIQYALREKESP